MQTYINIALIVLSVSLIASILLQARGDLGGSAFGMDSGMAGQYKTRRGLEKTLFQVTIGLSVAFFILVLVSSLLLA